MNFAALVLTYREGLEGALIIAIMLGYLKKVGRRNQNGPVWAGALSAAGLAVSFTIVLQIIGSSFQDPAKAIYEGGTSLLAVGMMSYMIFWMSRQARYIKGSLEQSMKDSFVQGASWGLFSVAFLTVAREGVETALFLSASAFQTSELATLLGGIAGIGFAVVTAYAIYVAGVRLNMRIFFKITSVLLVIFAASIFRYAVHEFDELGWIPTIIDPVWNTSGLLPQDSTLGSILQTLVGYADQPSLIEVIAYFGYLIVAGTLLLRPAPQKTVVTTAPTSPQAPIETVPVDEPAAVRR